MANTKINIEMPNLLLVAGNGRNVGKTFFVRQVIKHLSEKTMVYGLKISAHFHPVNESDILEKNNDFIIIEEKQINKKDSSLMLQAGAKKVYFLMAAPEHLKQAFDCLSKYLPQCAIVCESGGLHEIVTPGLFFFVNKPGQHVEKTQHLKHNLIVVNNDGTMIDFDISTINFSASKSLFCLKQL